MTSIENNEQDKRPDKPVKPVKPETYKLDVQGVIIKTERPVIVTRAAIKEAGFDPDAGWIIVLKIAGEPRKEIELNYKIDLTHPGIEKLRLTPRQINNGEAAAQRLDFRMLPQDEAHLGRLGLRWETVCEAGRRWLFLHGYPVPPGYNFQATDIAVDIPLSYPGAQLDMFYCFPALTLAGGASPPQTQHFEMIAGRNHQRWSRHRNWDSTRDTLATHLALIDESLSREVEP